MILLCQCTQPAKELKIIVNGINFKLYGCVNCKCVIRVKKDTITKK